MKQTQNENLYNALLYLYPEKYRADYSHEMRLIFHQMYQDQLKSQGSVGLRFWFKISLDLIQSTIERHIESLNQLGFKKYGRDILHFNNFNILALLLLVPFGTMMVIDLISRIAQGNWSHPNEAFYQSISQTPLYYQPILFTWVFILPALAAALSLTSILMATSQGKARVVSLPFLKMNFFSIIFLGIGLMCLGVMWGHDVVPCIGHRVFSQGLGNLPSIVSYCHTHA